MKRWNLRCVNFSFFFDSTSHDTYSRQLRQGQAPGLHVTKKNGNPQKLYQNYATQQYRFFDEPAKSLSTPHINAYMQTRITQSVGPSLSTLMRRPPPSAETAVSGCFSSWILPYELPCPTSNSNEQLHTWTQHSMQRFNHRRHRVINTLLIPTMTFQLRWQTMRVSPRGAPVCT